MWDAYVYISAKTKKFSHFERATIIATCLNPLNTKRNLLCIKTVRTAR
jgi:hypothetical protein